MRTHFDPYEVRSSSVDDEKLLWQISRRNKHRACTFSGRSRSKARDNLAKNDLQTCAKGLIDD